MRRTTVTAVLVCLCTASGAFAGRAATTDPSGCSELLAEGGLAPEERNICVRTVASTYLDGQRNAIGPGEILLADDALRYELGPKPDHRPDGATEIRATYPTDITRIEREEWVIDGDTAFVAYDIFTTSADERALVETDRITLRDGLIWEILTVAAPPPAEDYGYPSAAAVITMGVPPDTDDHSQVDPDDGHWCSVAIAEGAMLTADEHRRCMIAIASTYLDSEENTAPGWAVLMDPRGLGHSQGQIPVHRMGGGDTVRGRQGVTGPNMVIADITNREFAVDTDEVWVRYDGYTRFGLLAPDFFVMERFRIRNGLIWEIMVPPIAACPAGGNCFVAYL